MENLNKENFWNDLQEKYPLGLKVFCDWIDNYKEKVEWKKLFNCGSQVNYNGFAHDIKFHHLPLAMQIGIWIEFVCERGGCTWEIEDVFDHDWEEEIRGYVEMLHDDLRGDDLPPVDKHTDGTLKANGFKL